MRSAFTHLIVGVITVLGAALVSPNVYASKGSLESRLEQIERTLDSQLNTELLNQVRQLQEEVRNLRGAIEEQAHDLQLLNKRQETLYQNIEQRVDKLALSEKKNQVELASAIIPVKAQKLVKESVATVNPEATAYQKAYKLFNDKNFKAAEAALQEFVWQYPNGQYAANADYWLAEIYLEKWHLDKTDSISLNKAKDAFGHITEHYKDHQKVADSMFKLAMIAKEEGNVVEAKDILTKLIAVKPHSSSANLAKIQLNKLK